MKRRIWMKCILIGILLAAMMYVLYWFKQERASVLTLELTTGNAECRTGEVFDPMAYIAVCQGKNAELILPSYPDTKHAGTYLLVYRLKNQRNEIQRELYLTVSDKDSKAFN